LLQTWFFNNSLSIWEGKHRCREHGSHSKIEVVIAGHGDLSAQGVLLADENAKADEMNEI